MVLEVGIENAHLTDGQHAQGIRRVGFNILGRTRRESSLRGTRVTRLEGHPIPLVRDVHRLSSVVTFAAFVSARGAFRHAEAAHQGATIRLIVHGFGELSDLD